MNTVDEKLNLIENSVSDIKQAINDKGGSISGNISTYASAIRNLPSGGGSDAIINQNADGISPLYVWNGTEEEWNNGRTENFYNWQRTEYEIEQWNSANVSSIVGQVVYGNGKFVARSGIAANNTFYYSIDGITWTSKQGPLNYGKISFCNDRFFWLYENAYAYSSDGINWTQGTLPSVGNTWQVIRYCKDKFVAVAGYAKIAVSDNGIDWEVRDLPTYPYPSPIWGDIAYLNGMYVISSSGSGGGVSSATLYSTDLTNWTLNGTPFNGYLKMNVVNGMFMIMDTYYQGNSFAYSTDGINWTSGSIGNFSNWMRGIEYGNGFYIAIKGNQTKTFAYSKDLINWTSGQMLGLYAENIAFGNNTFVVVGGTSGGFQAIQYMNTEKSHFIFTDTETPDTSSTVYSEPSVESSLTITETGTNTITLSDENVYDRNQAGDAIVTQTIGEVHPDYISFIDGVGVRIGTTDIADM